MPSTLTTRKKLLYHSFQYNFLERRGRGFPCEARATAQDCHLLGKLCHEESCSAGSDQATPAAAPAHLPLLHCLQGERGWRLSRSRSGAGLLQLRATPRARHFQEPQFLHPENDSICSSSRKWPHSLGHSMAAKLELNNAFRVALSSRSTHPCPTPGIRSFPFAGFLTVLQFGQDLATLSISPCVAEFRPQRAHRGGICRPVCWKSPAEPNLLWHRGKYWFHTTDGSLAQALITPHLKLPGLVSWV